MSSLHVLASRSIASANSMLEQPIPESEISLDLEEENNFGSEAPTDFFRKFLHQRARIREQRSEEWKRLIDGFVVEQKNFGSVFPVRKNSYVQWFVDAASFMEHAANMMEIAREEIFIAGWHVSPELHLKRPISNDNQWRLDVLLQRKAAQGVRVYVLLYKDIEMAINLKSSYTKKRLQGLHPHIRVLRHPDHVSLKSSILKWTHHEKLVCVDQHFAYVGGVDLAFGRWDTHHHQLTDVGRRSASQPPKFPAQRRKSTVFGELAVHSIGVREIGLTMSYKRKPSTWDKFKRSVSIGSSDSAAAQEYLQDILDGEQASESDCELADDNAGNVVSEHLHSGLLIRGLGHVRDFYRKHRPHTLLEDYYQEHWINAFKETVSVSQDTASDDTITMPYLWVGKDYTNFPVKDFDRLDFPDEDLVNRWTIPRMPWHDIHTAVYGLVARDVASHFIERWNAVMQAGVTLGVHRHLNQHSDRWTPKHAVGIRPYVTGDEPLVTERIGSVGNWWLSRLATCLLSDMGIQSPVHLEERSKPKLGSMKYPRLKLKADRVPVPHIFRYMKNKCKVQLLRSVSDWTLPWLVKPCDSIHKAYLHLIATSKHYIYIENQFFVSMIDGQHVENYICQALCDRIVRAKSLGQKFRVFIVLPLRPSFEGKIGSDSGGATHAMFKYQYESLCRGKHSLIENVRLRQVHNPDDYISICSLRTHGILEEKLVTEMVYIHSKLLLVDDRKCLIGSANINDRSLIGSRDTEAVLYVCDESHEHSKMNGRDFKAGRFCTALRKHIFKEFLGLLHSSKTNQEQKREAGINANLIVDPVCDEFFHGIWEATARRNSEIFSEVFRCIPTNMVHSFHGLKKWEALQPLAVTNKPRALDLLKQIQGYLVQFPRDFLKEEELTPPVMSKEGIIPHAIFT